MKRFLLASGLALAALALAAAVGVAQERPGVPGGSTGPTHSAHIARYRAEVIREITDLMDRWRDAWAGKDAVRLASLYTDDALLVWTEGTEPIRGKDAVRSHFQELLPELGDVQASILDLEPDGLVAFLYGTFEFGLVPGDGATRRVHGSLTSALRREGRYWKIRAQVFGASPGSGR